MAPWGKEIGVITPLASHPVILRNRTSDIKVFSQIFLHREYRCLDHVEDAHLIIDCGANVGLASAYFLSRYPAARLIAVEPQLGNFKVLEKNLAPYGDRCSAVQGGIWSTSTDLVVLDHPMGDWAFTVRPANPGEQPRVEAFDIGSLLGESGLERISILKIDIEGAEDEVFSRNTSSWINRFDHLVIELHGQRSRSIVMGALDLDEFDIIECEELTVFSRRDV
ncbi:FkbM family methyltransferase [bacterium]|nr:FkbM family methyltransferase [bacterium]